jgi:hypothetical protein
VDCRSNRESSGEALTFLSQSHVPLNSRSTKTRCTSIITLVVSVSLLLPFLIPICLRGPVYLLSLTMWISPMSCNSPTPLRCESLSQVISVERDVRKVPERRAASAVRAKFSSSSWSSYVRRLWSFPSPSPCIMAEAIISIHSVPTRYCAENRFGDRSGVGGLPC